MAKSKPSEARRFLRVAVQRFEDAEILLKNDRTTGATYLAGYTVECALKAVIFAHSRVAEHAVILKSFRGILGHNLEWLQGVLRKRKVVPPGSVLTALLDVMRVCAGSARSGRRPGCAGADPGPVRSARSLRCRWRSRWRTGRR